MRDTVAPLIPVLEGVAASEAAPKPQRKKREPVRVDLSKPPVLSEGGRRGAVRKSVAQGDAGDDDDHDAAVVEDTDDDGDDENPQYYVLRIDGREVRGGREFYHVWWDNPYLGEHSWEPASELEGSARLIKEYLRMHDPDAVAQLTANNMAARELGRQARAAEEEARQAAMVPCERCGKLFNGNRGLTNHKRHCKVPHASQDKDQ